MYKKEIYNLIEKALKDLGIEEVPNFTVSYPPNEKMGDYTTNAAMIAAKIWKKAPMEIADAIKSKVKSPRTTSLRGRQKSKVVEKIEVAPPGFINFYLKPEVVQKNLATILKQKDKFGSTWFDKTHHKSLTASGKAIKIGKGKTIVIDYSAPNIAKMMHVGHLRSTIIGQAIYNIYKFLGYKTIGDNHIGDWGTHFGKLIYAYKNFANKKDLKKNFAKEMNRLYVDFNVRAKEDEKLNDYARVETKKFQEGDKENIKIWKYFARESIKEFNRIYKMLGVKIDYALGESFYQKMLGEIISSAFKKGVASRSQGAIIIPLEKYNIPPLMIQKSDGATLYGTTDLATIKYRMKKWNPKKILYIVANEQAGHFTQVFKSAEILGFIAPKQAIHVKFGMVLGPDGKKFSTREGKVILLKDLFGEAISRARKIVQEKNPKLSDAEKRKISKVVGIGAIKYNDLSQNRFTDITFNWDKMLDFRGNSAPYLQYTYARIKSILRRAKVSAAIKFKQELLNDEKELVILRQLILFDEVVERAGEEFMPNIIAEYLYKLANNFNLFYELVPVLKAEKDLRQARLALISAVAITLKNGLKLLGIETLERM
ncbi:arginine--tRNA ligase [Patescibacteria group bacterium]|nr:arginine--tRNA ligase [Patescibacteria group bacterium]MBU4368213.1 arginine--tRNA ligase [Patescibacteria group bacterium]